MLGLTCSLVSNFYEQTLIIVNRAVCKYLIFNKIACSVKMSNLLNINYLIKNAIFAPIN